MNHPFYHLLSKKHLASLSPEQARAERYFRGLQAVALLSLLYTCAALWVPDVGLPLSHLGFGMHVLYGPFLLGVLFIRVRREPWVRDALSAVLLVIAVLSAWWILDVIRSLDSVTVVDGRVFGVYSRPAFAVTLALHLVRALLAARLLISLRRASSAAYFGESASTATYASPTTGAPTTAPPSRVPRSAQPESAEGRLLRRCLRVFVALSVPWAIPCWYFAALEIAEPRRVDGLMYPSNGSIAIAMLIYTVFGPIPLIVARIGFKRSPASYRTLSIMLWACALLSIGYVCAAAHVLLSGRVSGGCPGSC